MRPDPLVRVVQDMLGEGAAPVDALRSILLAAGLARGLDPATAPPRVDDRPEVSPQEGLPVALLAGVLSTLGPVHEGVAASGRRATGRYYTPPALVEVVLDTTLEPALDDREGALDTLRVLDPCCGAGAFLLAAGRRLVDRRLRGAPETLETRAAAWAHVVTHNLYGVDLDPGAVEVCRGLLWLASGVAPPAAHVRCGDALLGADPQVIGAGLPPSVFQARAPAERAVVARWRKRSREAGPTRPGTPDGWCAAFLWPRTDDAPPLPDADEGTDATRRQVRALAAEHRFLHWPWAFPEAWAAGGFDVVLGNPPFLNQLQTGSVQDRGAAALVNTILADAPGAYTDIAAMLLLRGWTLVRPGGWLGMVQPRAVLAAQDAVRIRSRLAAGGRLHHLWVADGLVFPGADVHVCAVTLHRAPSASCTVLTRSRGLPPIPVPPLELDGVALPREDSWAGLSPAPPGAPILVFPPSSGADAARPGDPAMGRLTPLRQLVEVAATTADFRDEYYGLQPFLIDALVGDERRQPRLLTVGLVDPAQSLWGTRPTRCGRRGWVHPRVDVGAAQQDPRVAAWLARRQRPKILVATQTRVLEALVDEVGDWVATTPMLIVTPAPERLWHVAAVLLSPVASAWAFTRYAGAALNPDAIKLSAGQVGRIPLPREGPDWDAAAAAIRAAHTTARPRPHLEAAARHMLAAYDIDDDALFAWWAGRLPTR